MTANFSLKNILNYLAVFTIFTGAWSLTVILPFWGYTDIRILYFLFLALLILWLPFLKGLYFNKAFLGLFILIICLSFFNIFIGVNSLQGFLKQMTGISFSAIFFYLLLKINNYDVKRIFKIYLNIAFIVAFIGIIQEVSFFLGFKPGYDYSYFIPTWKLTYIHGGGILKINSIFAEPSHFCNVMAPAFFTSLISFFKNGPRLQKRWKSLIIIGAFVFSFSAVGYAGLLFSLVLIAFNCLKLRKRLVVFAFITAVFLIFYIGNYGFRYRVDESVTFLKGEKRIEETMPSVFAWYSNALITSRVFRNSPIFGYGLGSHEGSYMKYMGKVMDIEKIYNIYNPRDANSLFLRLLSETGILGLAIMFIFIFRFHIKPISDKTNYLWVINNAILVMFFIKLIRMGHYFIDGFFLFIWLYYFTKIKSKQEFTMENKLAGETNK